MFAAISKDWKIYILCMYPIATCLVSFRLRFVFPCCLHGISERNEKSKIYRGKIVSNLMLVTKAPLQMIEFIGLQNAGGVFFFVVSHGLMGHVLHSVGYKFFHNWPLDSYRVIDSVSKCEVRKTSATTAPTIGIALFFHSSH